MNHDGKVSTYVRTRQPRIKEGFTPNFKEINPPIGVKAPCRIFFDAETKIKSS